MSEPKPLASLSPQLLARKGGARPAMRPAMSALAVAPLDADQDDLGWNDMGETRPGESPVQQSGLAVSSLSGADKAGLSIAAPQVAIVPPVVLQQRELARKVQGQAAAPAGRRAAFTLRLDAERHLKLRLASTIASRSAQQLITDALDQFLASLPGVDSLAEQVRKRR